MRKIDVILFFGILLGGCTVSKRLENSKTEVFDRSLIGNILESVKDENITNNGFFIEKADIEIEGENGDQKFTCNIKFEKPDKYLISLKGRSGIEGARIYISEDTILVNDRINRKMYLANSFYLNRKYGFSISCLPLIFGDIVLDTGEKEKIGRCLDNRFRTDCLIKGSIVSYEIDCKRKKILFADVSNNSVQQSVRLEFNSFFYVNNILIPKIAEFVENQFRTTVRIKIRKIIFPWNGSIKFVPGKDYEIIKLV